MKKYRKMLVLSLLLVIGISACGSKTNDRKSGE